MPFRLRLENVVEAEMSRTCGGGRCWPEPGTKVGAQESQAGGHTALTQLLLLEFK